MCLCLCLFLIVLTPFCSWRVIFTEIIFLSNFWNAHDGWPNIDHRCQLSVTSVDDHLMSKGLKCNVQPFTDRPQATATMLRGEFLFKNVQMYSFLKSLLWSIPLCRLLDQTKMGLSGYEPTMEDMRGIFLAQGPGKIHRVENTQGGIMSHEESS